MGPKFLDLLAQSVIVQGILTLMVVSVECYLFVVGRTPPPELSALVGLVVGFYFGGKLQNALHEQQGKQ